MKSELLENELNAKQKELASVAMFLVEKNECLSKLKSQAETISKSKFEEIPSITRNMINSINQKLNTEETWTVFETQFNQIHAGFIERIAQAFPDLSLTELKICSLLKIQLSSKEIASILSISYRTVEDHRLNIRKKFGLGREESLTGYILNWNQNGIKH